MFQRGVNHGDSLLDLRDSLYRLAEVAFDVVPVAPPFIGIAERGFDRYSAERTQRKEAGKGQRHAAADRGAADVRGLDFERGHQFGKRLGMIFDAVVALNAIGVAMARHVP